MPLAANVSIPEGGDVVMHVGDDLFGGTINSQFQKKPDGAELNFKINDWATQVGKAGITKATVVLDAKGWQTIDGSGLQERDPAGRRRRHGDASRRRFTGQWQLGRRPSSAVRISRWHRSGR